VARRPAHKAQVAPRAGGLRPGRVFGQAAVRPRARPLRSGLATHRRKLIAANSVRRPSERALAAWQVRLAGVHSTAPVRIAVGLLRAVVGAFTISVLLYTFGLDIEGRDANPFNYFGYFTNQTSLFMGVVFIATGFLTIARRELSRWLTLLRGVGTAYLIVVAVIYNVLVPGTGSAPPWVSAVLHVVVPTIVVFDWVLVNDRRPLPWPRLWILLPYPFVWLLVVLGRGMTDGWVPYGFLLPENGLISLILYIVGLVCAVMIAGIVVWLASRLSIYPRTTLGRFGPRDAR
jgi:hypothetical protein